MNDRPLYYNGRWLEYSKETGLFEHCYADYINRADFWFTRQLVRLHELDRITDEFDRHSIRKD